MNFLSILDFDARLSEQMRVAEKPGALRTIAAFFAHSGDSWFWARHRWSIERITGTVRSEPGYAPS